MEFSLFSFSPTSLFPQALSVLPVYFFSLPAVSNILLATRAYDSSKAASNAGPLPPLYELVGRRDSYGSQSLEVFFLTP